MQQRAPKAKPTTCECDPTTSPPKIKPSPSKRRPSASRSKNMPDTHTPARSSTARKPTPKPTKGREPTEPKPKPTKKLRPVHSKINPGRPNHADPSDPPSFRQNRDRGQEPEYRQGTRI
ncbi:hypothetical protein ATANTOWER_015221 [Ataeniobius toweri]|uniref:Uncharacterized protein n=1 Tax=Ataeniobius toweri TaxID=208326 RepID=A0ABU7B9E7_9TELE|nr:hypothetical protein [Ataeniobius toweri]